MPHLFWIRRARELGADSIDGRVKDKIETFYFYIHQQALGMFVDEYVGRSLGVRFDDLEGLYR